MTLPKTNNDPPRPAFRRAGTIMMGGGLISTIIFVLVGIFFPTSILIQLLAAIGLAVMFFGAVLYYSNDF